MNAMVEHKEQHGVGILASLAGHYGMNKDAFVQTVKATVMPSNVNVSNEQLAAFCLVAKQYNLNPFTKEIFAFPSRGGIQPVVSIDGWMKLINSHPDFDGMTFVDQIGENGLVAITCRMHRKNHTHPVEVTEYMAECRRQTDTWKQWPARMLRHKAAIQAARYAFSFAGIMEPDEVERIDDKPEMVPQVTIVDERQKRHDDAVEQYEMSIQYIKDQIALWDDNQDESHLYSVAEAWREIPNAAQMDLWVAQSKGGIFSTHERDVIKSKLPKAE